MLTLKTNFKNEAEEWLEGLCTGERKACSDMYLWILVGMKMRVHSWAAVAQAFNSSTWEAEAGGSL